jgi:hypothetical protein
MTIPSYYNASFLDVNRVAYKYLRYTYTDAPNETNTGKLAQVFKIPGTGYFTPVAMDFGGYSATYDADYGQNLYAVLCNVDEDRPTIHFSLSEPGNGGGARRNNPIVPVERLHPIFLPTRIYPQE